MFFLDIVGIEISLELRIAEFVPGLEFSIFLTIALDSIIGKMNVDIIDVIGVIVLRTGPDISFVVPIVFGS